MGHLSFCKNVYTLVNVFTHLINRNTKSIAGRVNAGTKKSKSRNTKKRKPRTWKVKYDIIRFKKSVLEFPLWISG